MENSQKLKTFGYKTQDKDKQNDNKTQHNMCWIQLYANKLK